MPARTITILAVYLTLSGIISLAGWAFDVPLLSDWAANGTAIQPNSAIATFFSGLAFLLIVFERRALSLFAGAVTGIIGLSAVFQFITGFDLRIDTLFLFGREWGQAGFSSPGRMGPGAAVSWFFTGTAIIAHVLSGSGNFGRGVRDQLGSVAMILAAGSFGISILSITGYLYNAHELYSLPGLSTIAFQASTYILAATLATFLLFPERGPARILFSDTPAGALVRRALPILILLPIALGLLRVQGQRWGMYDLELGMAIRALTEIVVLLALLWWATKAVTRESDRAQSHKNELIQVADSMPQVVWLTGSDGVVRYFNQRVSAFADTVASGDGNPYWIVALHPDDLQPTLAAWSKALEKGVEFTQEHRVRMADESYRWHLSRAIPVTEPESGELRWFGSSTDIDDLKRSADKLRSSEERFASFMENLPGLAWIKDADGRYLYVNSSAESAFGISTDEIYKKTDAEIFPARTADAFMENDRKAIVGGIQTVEELDAADGTTRVSLVNKFPIGQNGSAPLIGGVAIDITDQKRVQDDQEFLFRIADLIRTESNPVTLLYRVSEAVGRHLNLHRCLFNEIDLARDAETVHRHFYRSGDSVAGEHSISSYSSETSRLMAHGRTVINRDSRSDSRTAAFFDKVYGPAEELSYIAVPMLREGEWVASLWCSDDKPRGWTANDVSLVENVAERVWSAVERSRAENALRSSEEKFRSLFESIDEGFVIVEIIFDPVGRPSDYRFVEANPSFTRLTGLPGDALGKTARELVPGLEEFWFVTFGRVATSGESVRFENHSEAMNRWFDVYASRIGGEGSNRVAIVFNNITGRKLVEDALRESEERFSKAFRASPLVLTISSLETGKLVEVNDTFVEVTGYAREEAIGKTTLELGLWLEPADRSSEMNAVRENGQVRGEEYVFRLRDGTEIVGLLAAERIEISGEACSLTVIQDITERKFTEAALRESEARFRNISDAAPVLIWVSDATKKCTWFNQPWLDFTGRSMAEEVGDGWTDRIHPDDLQRCLHIYNTSFDKRLQFSVEYRMRRFDGEYRWLLDSGIPRFSGAGEFVGYIGACIDIDDRRAAESALRQSEARLQLATGIGNFGTWDLNFVDGRMIWSDKLFQIFGMSPTPDRTVERDVYRSRVSPSDLGSLGDLNEAALRSREEFSAEFRITREDDGKTRWLRAVARFFYDKNGNVVRSVGVAQDITERKLAEETLRESEHRFKLAQEAGNVGIWDWDAASDETFWSDKMWSFYGVKPLSIYPDNTFWEEHLHPHDRSRVIAGVNAALESLSSSYGDEFRIVRKNGEIRWLESAATIERDEAGRATRMYGVNLDITEKKQTAELIRASEAQLRLITDSIPALVSYIDKNEQYRFVNKQYTDWFGIENEDLLGCTMTEVLGRQARDQLKLRVDQVLTGEVVTFESWLDYRAVGRRFVHVSYVPDVDKDGAVAGFYALVTDLTEQKRSEDLLASSEKRVQLLTDSFTDYAIISLDPDGVISSWNPGAEYIFGYSADEIIGKPASILFTPEDTARGVPVQELERARRSGRASDERWHIRKDGSRFFANGVMAPLYVGEALTGYAKIAADLTEKKRNSEALQRAYDEMEMRVLERTRELSETNAALIEAINERKTSERQKITLLQRLVSSQEDERQRIARDLHDHLGQRLTALRLKLASLCDACKGDEDLYLRATRLQQIAELIDTDVSFLAWELRPSVLDELGLVEAIETFIKEWSRHYDIAVDFHTTGLSEKRLDREMETHLYRITQETLNNVVKHSEASAVSVLLERSGDNVVLIVEDNGKGFDVARVMNSEHGLGRGLGLSGIRERAELIGGSMEIESEPGSGTTVYVRVFITDLRLLRHD